MAPDLPAPTARALDPKEAVPVAAPPVQEGLAIHDGVRFLHVDETFARLLGHSSPRDLVGTRVLALLAEQARHEVVQRIRGDEVTPYETDLRTRDGHIVHVAVKPSMVPFADGQARAVAIRVIPDAVPVVPIWHTAQPAAPTAPPTQQANSIAAPPSLQTPATAQAPSGSGLSLRVGPSVAPVAGGAATLTALDAVAHELSAPLTPLRLQLHLLRSQALGNLAEPQSRSLEVAQRSVNRLAELAQELHDFAILQAGSLPIRATPMHIGPAIDEAIASFQEAAHKAGIKLGALVTPDLAVEGDAQRLQQLLYILLSNAVKFTPAGGRVTVRATADANGDVVLAVQDTGAGVPSESLPLLFVPFSRPHPTPAAGPGLGLYIAKGIVEAHGGTLLCSSAGLGQGATFSATLPKATSEPTPAPPEQADPAADPGSARSLSWRMRRLI